MNVYAFIIPIVLVLLLAEIIYSIRTKNGMYPFQDTVTNIATGIGNQCVNLAVAFFVYKWYGWLYQFAPWEIPATWYWLLILLIFQDFIFYWFHRIGHTINIFWAAHMPHHSSEELNLSVGIRASFTQRLFQFLFFDWILVLVGFSPEMVYAMAAVHLLLAYWHHTQLIKKLGWFEKFFVTPSHHRVHHGVNPQYLDKNYSEFLIIWDKLFGTFEEEREEVCYGVTHPPRTWDPIFINFQYWKQLWDDAVATRSWWDKVRLWFMPLGWRPPDLRTNEKKQLGYTRKEQVKYVSKQYKGVRPYLIVQIVLAMAYLMVTVDLSNPLTYVHRLVLSIGVFLMIIAWGGLLQARRWSLGVEVLRLVYMAIALVVVLDFAGMMAYTSWLTIVAGLCAGGSILYCTFFVKKKELESPQLAYS
ncbi:sterol desaturase family protein [Marinoscillum furvescens]|uniref:Sterol desaturase/sphingolipid hydroxylase (Fatty acid hydroxylase superfamily) n=1 Tax=Marinoscillum furvescens DSM 4134 TaxID=1122208 RepID=A0A3D9L0E1_MARFU|nr:sterol desaturase family protein [Marinoscillum furvescens]RED93375.1 sterol desaturase/sphingolipid hydroxylase (fatty acid hydroxylase superfamily) [Marinoscillum furvescens DSM 4134]